MYGLYIVRLEPQAYFLQDSLYRIEVISAAEATFARAAGLVLTHEPKSDGYTPKNKDEYQTHGQSHWVIATVVYFLLYFATSCSVVHASTA